jgi:hypothetical protein
MSMAGGSPKWTEPPLPSIPTALPHLRQVSSLKVLNLMGTQVTPVGLRQLRGMPRLREVGVDASTFTAEDVRCLNADLPGVGVVRYVRVRDPYVGWRWVRADDGTAGDGGSKNENVSPPATGPSQ